MNNNVESKSKADIANRCSDSQSLESESSANLVKRQNQNDLRDPQSQNKQIKTSNDDILNLYQNLKQDGDNDDDLSPYNFTDNTGQPSLTIQKESVEPASNFQRKRSTKLNQKQAAKNDKKVNSNDSYQENNEVSGDEEESEEKKMKR